MSTLVVVGVAAAGAVGAAARYLVDSAVMARWRGPFPAGTLAVNVVGSLLLGLVTGWGLRHGVADGWRTVLGTGFCGAFTTFSTASLGAVRLLQQSRPRLAALAVLANLGLSTVAAAVGLALAG